MRKIISLFVFACFFCTWAKAQLDPNVYLRYKEMDTTDTAQIVMSPIFINAVIPALSVIRQQYRLELNGDYYGKKGNPYYGESYTLGVKISNNTILQRGVILPWENDADYQRVNAGGKYTPTYFRSFQRPITETEWKATEFDFGTQFTTPTSSDSLLFLNQDKVADFGLPDDRTEGTKQGLLIWVYSTTNNQDSAMQIRYQQSSMTIDAKADSSCISIKPDNIDNVLGGIFVVPQIERVGYIKVLLVGVAVKDSNNEWKLKLLTESTEAKEVDNPVKQSDDSDRKKKESEDENMSDNADPTPIK